MTKADSFESPPTPQIVIQSLRWTHLLKSIYWRVQALDVFYVGFGTRSRLLMSAAKRMNLKPSVLSQLTEVRYRELSDRWPGVALGQSRDILKVAELMQKLSTVAWRSQIPNDLLVAALMKECADPFPMLVILDLWVNSSGTRTKRIYVDDYLSEALLKSMNPKISVRVTGGRSRRLTWRLLKLASPILVLISSIDKKFTEVKSAGLGGTENSLLVVANRGLSYGKLYDYGFFHENDPDSPLNASNCYTLFVAESMNQSPVGALSIRCLYGSRFRRWVRGLTLFTRADDQCGANLEMEICWKAAFLLARTESASMRLKSYFPSVKAAMYVFEYQVPPTLTLGLALAGIRSFAASERPNMCFHESMPVLCDTYFTAADSFGLSVRELPMSYARETISVGLWRTDFFDAETNPPDAPKDSSRDISNRPLVVVLPFVVIESQDEGDCESYLSVEAFQHFIQGVLVLAESRPACDFLIRAKTIEWMSHPNLQDLVVRVSTTKNVSVSQDYESVGVSYALCQRAALVIAKYTSLVDECLSINVPVLIHDYSHNGSGRLRRSNMYLDRELFVLSDVEFAKKANDILNDRGHAFREWWSPKRIELYGEWADGQVAIRIRKTLMDYLVV